MGELFYTGIYPSEGGAALAVSRCISSEARVGTIRNIQQYSVYNKKNPLIIVHSITID